MIDQSVCDTVTGSRVKPSCIKPVNISYYNTIALYKHKQLILILHSFKFPVFNFFEIYHGSAANHLMFCLAMVLQLIYVDCTQRKFVSAEIKIFAEELSFLLFKINKKQYLFEDCCNCSLDFLNFTEIKILVVRWVKPSTCVAILLWQ